ncbi:DNA-binding protein, partial [Bosea sp. FBZP-16]|uniref:DNA-binding protein n=1 Tax=Bosea sp. FBZP-16 TaxID=2065382 RepID=UPI0024A68EC9
MKLWLTSSEIADLALPGLPTSRKNVLALAEREDWAQFASLCRQRDGRGGGVEYHVSLLPATARAEYFVRAGGAQLEQAASLALQAAPDLAIAGQAAGEQLDARIAILGALRAFQRAAELQQTVAIALFVDLYNLGRADVPGWVRERVRR